MVGCGPFLLVIPAIAYRESGESIIQKCARSFVVDDRRSAVVSGRCMSKGEEITDDLPPVGDIVQRCRIGDCGGRRSLHRASRGRRLVLKGNRRHERQAHMVAKTGGRHGSDRTTDHVRTDRMWGERALERNRDRLADLERQAPLGQKTARGDVYERRSEARRRYLEPLD